MNKIDKVKPYAPVVVRIALSLVFFWFGYNQIMHPEVWIRIVPGWVAGMFGSAATVVAINGWFEVVASVMLVIGFQVRTVSLLLALHLIGIASGFGLSAIGVRDFGLSLATFSIFFNGADIWSIQTRLSAKFEQTRQL